MGATIKNTLSAWFIPRNIRHTVVVTGITDALQKEVVILYLTHIKTWYDKLQAEISSEMCEMIRIYMKCETFETEMKQKCEFKQNNDKMCY